jgi:hypothetical protein
MEFHAHAVVLRPRGVRQRLARNAADSVAFRPFNSVGTPDSLISRLNSPAYAHPYPRFATPSRVVDAGLGATVGR